ncbi:hypothetical protein ABEB36_000666 [Hypothenemus hampei]|uniref:Uncharacterized protein n=1 Tax=Hypothenemus hampei TaxID=57062 RepID=A0ABD1FFL3_HYPHA
MVALTTLVPFCLLVSYSVASLVAPVATPFVRYTQVAPPNVLPFAAQVSTFSRNLHVFDAPYAAGVIPGPPPIVQRAIWPTALYSRALPFLPAVAPAPFLAIAFNSMNVEALPLEKDAQSYQNINLKAYHPTKVEIKVKKHSNHGED